MIEVEIWTYGLKVTGVCSLLKWSEGVGGAHACACMTVAHACAWPMRDGEQCVKVAHAWWWPIRDDEWCVWVVDAWRWRTHMRGQVTCVAKCNARP